MALDTPSEPALTAASAAVLVVDDAAANRLAVRGALEGLGHTIVEVESGEEALKQLLVRDFAVVLLDVRLPGMTGVQVAELARARERTRHVPIIFLTGDTDRLLTSADAYRLGALDYVLKPVDPTLLRAKVAALADLYLRSERLRREEALLREREKAASDELFHKLLQSSPMGLVSSTEDLVLVEANDAFLSMVGRSRSELGKLRWPDLVDPQTAQQLQEPDGMGRRRAGGAPEELELVRSDGERIPVLLSATQVAGRGIWLSYVMDLRERRKAERQRELERQRLHSLFQQAPAAIAIMRGEPLEIELANPGFSALFGDRELVGKIAEQALPPLREQGILAKIEKVLRSGQSRAARQRPVRLTRADGSVEERFFNVAHHAMPGPGGRPESVITFAFEVTEEVRARNRAEELARDLERQRDALVRAEASANAVLEAIPQMVWMASSDGEVDFLNERWTGYTGRPRAELLIDGWTSIVHPEELPGVLHAWNESVATGRSFEREFRARAKDGSYRWMLARAVPLQTSPALRPRWFGTCTDIDAQRRERDQMRFLADASNILSSSLDYEDTLRSLADLAVPRFADFCAVDILGADGKVERLAVSHVDPARLELARRASEVLRPDPAAPRGTYHVIRTGTPELLPAITPEMVDQVPNPEARRVLRELGLVSSIQVPLFARGRALGTITFVSAESGYHYTQDDLVRAEDLARRAALAVDNARLFREAQQAIRLRDEFLSVASHELKTPLTPLTLRLQTLRKVSDREGTVEELRTHVKRTVESAQSQLRRLTVLVNDLLDVSRIAQGRLHLALEQLDLAALVREVAATFAEQAQRSEVHLDVSAPTPVTGVWDRLRLEQVVTNLLTNAFKYGAGHPVRLSVCQARGMARVEVQDQGIGIASEDLSRIFGRYERAVSERNYGGLGLGLYIAQQIVSALGGTIRADSALGKGATFTVELPLERSQGATSASG